MKVDWGKVIGLTMKYLPSLLSLAEGLFSFKAKSGADKKEFVSGALKTVVSAVATESDGGQADTWSEIEKPINDMIDAGVALANATGAFKDNSIISDLTKGLE